jgi:hypothetical protein
MMPWLKAKAKKGKMQPTRFKAYRGVADRSGCVWHYLPQY